MLVGLASMQVLQYLFSRPTSGGMATLKTGGLEVPGLNPDRACRPSRSEFSEIFSETLPHGGHSTYIPGPIRWKLDSNQQPTKQPTFFLIFLNNKSLTYARSYIVHNIYDNHYLHSYKIKNENNSTWVTFNSFFLFGNTFSS